MRSNASLHRAKPVFEAKGQQLHYAGAALFTGRVEDALDEIWRLKSLDSPQLVMTPNVDQSINIERDTEFRQIYRKAAVRFVDGAPLVALSRLLGVRETQRITGADLLPLICKRAASDGTRLLLLGGRTGVARLAAQKLAARHTELDIQHLDVPIFEHASETHALVPELVRMCPDIVFIGLGSPKQERWFDTWRENLPSAVFLGSGAAADFAAGSISRAPRLLQAAGLEWAYRFFQEPRRLFHRYMVKGPVFLAISARSIIYSVKKRQER